ncbi:hypothetical protein BG005_003927, partial [Podila minutissima]
MRVPLIEALPVDLEVLELQKTTSGSHSFHASKCCLIFTVTQELNVGKLTKLRGCHGSGLPPSVIWPGQFVAATIAPETKPRMCRKQLQYFEAWFS